MLVRSLGVRCSHCHMGEESDPLETYDFASDDKLLKRKAREMIRMMQAINGPHLSGGACQPVENVVSVIVLLPFGWMASTSAL
jgi:hypothetical protein